MVSLDAVGNTTKAVTKGFAIGSAVIAAVALFASFIETAGSELGVVAENLKDGVLRSPELAINAAEPKIFIGILVGGAVPFLFSALAIRAVGRTAGVVRRCSQFADGGSWLHEALDYGPVIDICTTARRELATRPCRRPGAIVIGFGIGWQPSAASSPPHPRRPADTTTYKFGGAWTTPRSTSRTASTAVRRPQGRRHRRHRRRPFKDTAGRRSTR
jgi:hypothetical protein